MVRLVFVLLALCLALSQGEVSAAPLTAEQELLAIFDKHMSLPVPSRFLSHQMAMDIRHGKDRSVTQVLESIPGYPLIEQEVQKMLDEYLKAYNTELLSRASQAMKQPAQHKKYLEMMERVASRLNFSPEIRKNAMVYLMATPEVNAFTPSGGPEIQFVILRGLIDSFHNGAKEISINLQEEEGIDMGPELIADMAIEAVIGHEIGHIKAGHVRNQVILISIFQSAGVDLIEAAGLAPQTSEEEKKLLQQKLSSALEQQLTATFTHTTWSRDPEKESPARKKVLAQLLAGTEKVSQMLEARLGRKTLNQVALNLFKALNHQEDTENQPVLKGLTEEAVEKFVNNLKILSRAMETTSDRFGQIAESTMGAEFADMLLAGATSRKAILVQAEKLRIQALENPNLESLVSEDTHPRPVYRALSYSHFEKDPIHRIYTNPFLKALHTYLAVANHIEWLQKVQDHDALEISTNYNAGIDRQYFEILEKDLMSFIVGQVMKDLQNPQGGFVILEEAAKYLGYREIYGRFAQRSPLNMGIAFRTNLKDGFFKELQNQIEALLSAQERTLKSKINEMLSKSKNKAEVENEVKKLVARFEMKVKIILSAANTLFQYVPPSQVNEAREKLKVLAEQYNELESGKDIEDGNEDVLFGPSLRTLSKKKSPGCEGLLLSVKNTPPSKGMALVYAFSGQRFIKEVLR